MSLKEKLRKIGCLSLVSLITFSSIQIANISKSKAVSLYAEATTSVKVVAENINITAFGAGHSDLFEINLGGTRAFCLDYGKGCKTGHKYAQVGGSVNSKIAQVLNWYNDQKDQNGYGEDFVYGMAQATIWAIKQGKVDDDTLAEAYEKLLVHYASGGAAGHGLAFVQIYYKGNGNGNAILEYSTAGSFQTWSYGSSSEQKLVVPRSVPDITYPEVRYKTVSSTKTYSKTENIKVQVNKADIDTKNKLSDVAFDFYKDGIKGGSAVTNYEGVAEYTFTTDFSKQATVTKDYCSNYSSLSIPNQGLVTGYTSKATAQAAADAEALEQAKKLAEVGSGEEHTYRVVETSTKTNYWLNPETATYEKKHTGEGTVEFNIGNKRQVGSITITKRDSETNNLVDNATYGLYARNPIIHPDGKTGQLYAKDQLVGAFPKTANNGTASLTNLYLGQYYVKEITAPSGYLHSSDVYNVDLNYAGQNIQVTDTSTTVKDKVQRASVNLIKQDKELNNGSKNPDIFDFNKDGSQGDASRIGAIYGLYAREDIVHADGASGIVTYNQIKDSIYELKATKGTGLSVKNVRATAGTLLATIKTDSNGEFGFEHLYNGKYFIKEIEPSTGYILDTTEYDFNLSYTNQSETVVTKNDTVLEQVAKQAFDLFKAGHVSGTSTNAKPLENVEFTVWLESDIQSFVKQGKTLVEAKQLAPVYDKLTTKADGTASSIELPHGKYRVAETSAAVDYATADDFFVTVNDDSRVHQSWTNNVIIDEKFTGLIQAIKLDKETGKQVKLEGVEFKIKNLDKNEYVGYWEWLPFPHYVSSWTTNSEGYVRLQEEFEAGHYQLEEVKAPDGYLLDTEPVKFQISNKSMYEIAEDGKTPLIKTYKSDTSVKGQISVEKKGEVLVGFNEKTGKFIYEQRGLANAKYNVIAKEDILDPSNDGTVLFKKGTVVETLVTGKDGKATTRKLPLGKYEIVEVEAPSGMVLNKNSQTVELKYKDQYTAIVMGSSSFVNERQRVEAKVVKVDSEQSTFGLSGGEFNFVAKDDIKNADGTVIVKANTVINKFVSDMNGEMSISEMDLPLDYDFELIETKAPIGYILDSTPVALNTDYQGQNIKKIVISKTKTNKATEVDFSKIDVTTGKELPGNHMTVFEKDNQGSSFETWISGDKPHTIKNLETDVKYILRETSSVKGFYLATDVEFEIDQKGNVYIYKDGNKVPAKDHLIVMENDLVKGRLDWNKQGEIFTHTDIGQNEFGKVETPVWEQSNLLQAEITIYAAEDITLGNDVTYYKADEKIQTLESDWESVQSKELPVGQYYYIETRVPHGYIGDTSKHYFEIEDNQKNELQVITSTLANERAKVNIDVKKVLEKQNLFINNNAYKDIMFGVFAREDICNYMGEVAIENGTMIYTSGINENGMLVLTDIIDLPIGAYYIQELATNDQYILNDNQYDFEIGYPGSDVTEFTIQINGGTIENKLARGSIQVKKIDSLDGDKKLENIEFNISTNKDMSNIFKTLKTDNNGYVIFNELELGTYYVQEAKQADGYLLNNHIYQVEITKDGDILTIECENQPTEMTFSKLDETGVKELPGATIKVVEKDSGKIIDKWTSNNENHIINYLIEGKEYIMQEISAPYGYSIAEEIVFVAKSGKKITMKNELILTDIQINKIDLNTKKMINLDVEFTMYSDAECTKVLKVVKGKGTTIFKDIPYSEVYFKETNAPKGYILSNEVKKVVINDKLEGVGKTHSFIYYNSLKSSPKTDDSTNISLYILLSGACGLILFNVLTNKKKENNDEID